VKNYLPTVALVIPAVIFAGCRQKQRPVAPQPYASSPITQNSPQAAPPLPPQTPLNYESDPVYQQAQSLSRSDIRKAMEVLEAAVSKAPDDPRSAPYYLQLGRLKKEYENYQNYGAATSELGEKQKKEYFEYAKARPSEYFYNEIGDDYFYVGTHFKELEKRFPLSPLAADAGYEITNLSQGGECEGFVLCYIESAFAPVHAFLLRYPDTPHTAEAAQRADDAFRKALWGDQWKTDLGDIKDPTKSTDYYDPRELKKLVDEYEELAEKLPQKFRARIWETAAYYREKLGEKDKSRTLYEKIATQFPGYENIEEIRQKRDTPR